MGKEKQKFDLETMGYYLAHVDKATGSILLQPAKARLLCTYCGLMVETEDEIKAHAMTCEKSPLVAEIKRLRGLLNDVVALDHKGDLTRDENEAGDWNHEWAELMRKCKVEG